MAFGGCRRSLPDSQWLPDASGGHCWICNDLRRFPNVTARFATACGGFRWSLLDSQRLSEASEGRCPIRNDFRRLTEVVSTTEMAYGGFRRSFAWQLWSGTGVLGSFLAEGSLPDGWIGQWALIPGSKGVRDAGHRECPQRSARRVEAGVSRKARQD